MQFSIPSVSSLSRENQKVLQHLRLSQSVSEDQHNILATESLLSKRSVASLAVELGFVPEDIICSLLSSLSGYPFVSLKEKKAPLEVMRRLPQDVAVATCAVPIEAPEKTLLCAMADPSDLSARDEISRFLRPEEKLSLVMAKRSDILSQIQYAFSLGAHGFSEGTIPVLGGESLHEVLQNLMTEAVAQIVSDIHFQPSRIFVTVRFRSDGLLRTVRCFHLTQWEPLCNQIKVLAGMDITETRRPQDGRFSLTILGRLIYFRASSHPTIYGESLVLRILEKDISLTKLDNLGYSPEALEKIQKLIAKPEGLVVVTGPTGSGKTTSLYSMLGLLDTQKLNIMTLEEPVEYRLASVRQSEVRENSSLTFTTGMHSILRQDPDVILLGEIRDAQTAHMAVRASMTGHKVFTTLHTNSALGVIQRFLDFQISLSLFMGLFSGIVAQRLLRLLCPACKKKHILNAEEARALNIWPQLYIYEPQGCEACLFQGYKGRRAIAEVIVMNKELESLILMQASLTDLQQELHRQGVKTLFQEAQEALLSGETSLQELRRVIGEGA